MCHAENLENENFLSIGLALFFTGFILLTGVQTIFQRHLVKAF